ncbi:MAG: hypothetical protein WC337_08170, partial [Candidatus Muiribacteriota bacterium]
MYKKIIIILILISGLNCFSMLEKAKNSFSQGNIVDAVEYYRQALVISENQKQTLEAISGLGACYVELGLKERAQFYYERYLDMEEDQAILEKLLNILIELEKFNQAEKYLTNLTDDFNRNKYMAVICEKRNNFKQAAAYYKKMYEFSNSLSYLDKALDYDISLYKDFNNSLEADIVYYSINQDSDSLEKTVLKFEKAGRNELFRLYEYFFHKNNILLVNVAEKLYELNKNVSDISRLIRAYYKFGQINKVNNFLNVIEEKMPAETIVNLLHNTFMELSMYDRALSYIKKIPNYQKNPDFFIKILDIYSAGMSYSLYYDEIEKLYISRIIDENFVNSRITSLLRARKEWADSFLSHSVRNHVTEYVLALGFHYSAKYDEAVKVLYNLDDNTRKQFFNYTNSIFIYADKVDYSKLESDTLIMMMPYMSAENLFELVLLEKFDVVNTALFKLAEVKKMT